jgi:hypothetical protein
MTLYRCKAAGVFPSTFPWSFTINFSSSATVATVETDWLAQMSSAWTNGTHGIETLFPSGTILETTSTAQLAIVHIGTVDKLREVATREDNPALAGTSANAALPDQNAILVSLRTDLPGKENRGRIHLPAPDVTLVTAGELGTTPTTRVSTAIAALLTGMGGAGHQAVVLTAVLTKAGTPVGNTRSINFPETDRIIRTVRARNKSRKAIYL